MHDPATQRVSPVDMGRLAYGAGIAGVTWPLALLLALEPNYHTYQRLGPFPAELVAAVVEHGPAALLVVLPIVLACAVFAPEAPARRHVTAFFFVPLAFAAFAVILVTLEKWAPSAPTILTAPTASELQRLAVPVLVIAAMAGLPPAPILSFATAAAPHQPDRDARARRRIGASLAAASILQLACLAFLGSSSEQLYLAAPSLAAFVFGLVEIVRSHRALAALRGTCE